MLSSTVAELWAKPEGLNFWRLLCLNISHPNITVQTFTAPIVTFTQCKISGVSYHMMDPDWLIH